MMMRFELRNEEKTNHTTKATKRMNSGRTSLLSSCILLAVIYVLPPEPQVHLDLRTRIVLDSFEF